MAGFLASALLGGAAGGFKAMGDIATDNIDQKREDKKQEALFKRQLALERLRNKHANARQSAGFEHAEDMQKGKQGFLKSQQTDLFARQDERIDDERAYKKSQQDSGYQTEAGRPLTMEEYNSMSEEDRSKLRSKAEIESAAIKGERQHDINLQLMKNQGKGDDIKQKIIDTAMDFYKADVTDLTRPEEAKTIWESSLQRAQELHAAGDSPSPAGGNEKIYQEAANEITNALVAGNTDKVVEALSGAGKEDLKGVLSKMPPDMARKVIAVLRDANTGKTEETPESEKPAIGGLLKSSHTSKDTQPPAQDRLAPAKDVYGATKKALRPVGDGIDNWIRRLQK